MKLRKTILYACLAIATCAISFRADAVGYSKYTKVTPTSGELFGMEIEIAGERNLGNLFSVFNFNVSTYEGRRIADHLSVEELDSYLTPSTLEHLPPAVRAGLLEGIELGGKIALDGKMIISSSRETRPAPSADVRGTTTHSAKPARTASGLIVPSRILDVESSNSILLSPSAKSSLNPPPSVVAVEPVLRSELAWNTVVERWKQLQDRQALIDVNRLHRTTRARLVFSEVVPVRLLELKPDAPPKIRELFSRLAWSFEPGGNVEFRHLEPVSDPDKFHADRELFSDIAGIRRYVDDPTLPVPDDVKFSYQWHGSKYGSSLKAILPYEKRLRLIDLTLAGRADSMLNTVSYYNYDATRGPVIQAADDHIESRQHAEPPRKEFDRIRRLMNLPPEQAVLEIEKHITARSTLLQNRILDSLKAGDRPRDAHNELVALIRADPNSASDFVAKNRTFLQKTIPISTVASFVTPDSVSALIPLFDSPEVFKENFKLLFSAALRSPEPQALDELEHAIGKLGISTDAADKLFSDGLGQVASASSPQMPLNFASAVKVIQRHGFSDLDFLIPKLMSNCEDVKCLGGILDSLGDLLKPPASLSEKIANSIRNFAFRTPVGIEVIDTVQRNWELRKDQLDFLLVHGGKSQGEVIDQLVRTGDIHGADVPRALAKLIESEYPLSRRTVEIAQKKWSQRQFPDDWKVVFDRLDKVPQAADARAILNAVRLEEILKHARDGQYISSADLRFLLKSGGTDHADAIDTLLRKKLISSKDIGAAFKKLIDLDVPISPAALDWLRLTWPAVDGQEADAVKAALLKSFETGGSTRKAHVKQIAKTLKIPFLKLRTERLITSKVSNCASWFSGLAKSAKRRR